LFYTILRSQIMDWKRKQARRSKWLVWFSAGDEDEHEDSLAQIATPVDINPATLLANVGDVVLVQQVLAGLPARQQQAFLLRAWEELDIGTTARIMDCSESSVKTHYARALQTLRQHLHQSHSPQEHSS
jgi:RNA polymerase sigma-70 factor (ECF subfamily)